jgi:hypothetical protein
VGDQEVSLFLSNPVVVGDTLFGLSEKARGQFFALDAHSGKGALARSASPGLEYRHRQGRESSPAAERRRRG